MIEGVKLTDLRIIADHRGSVRHMLRNDSQDFQGFGEIYFSTVNKGVVKAWHLHKEMTLNYACVVGHIVVAVVDLRKDSPTFGDQDLYWLESEGEGYKLLTIPPQVWNGFRIPVGSPLESAMVANCATLPHSPDEIVRLHPNDFPVPFDWGHFDYAG